MLKVVGASWEQTRLTSMMLFAIGVVAIFILFYDVPPVIDDGYYAATVYWSPQTGFRVEYLGQNNDPKTIKRGVARAYYKEDQGENGWSSLEIQTSGQHADWIQAYSAGFLEGVLSWQMMYWHWQNTVKGLCQTATELCDKFRSVLIENEEIIRREARLKESNSPFWHQVNMFYVQLEGLEVGWNQGKERSRRQFVEDIPHVDFLWMNHVHDIMDMALEYNGTELIQIEPPATLAFLKYLGANSTQKFLLGHMTAGSYSQMLRVKKKYDFSYKLIARGSNTQVAGQVIEFTSYPGSIHSLDDFYRVSSPNGSSLAIVSAPIAINSTVSQGSMNWRKTLMAARVMAANRLAKNGADWAILMKKGNSGSGNKQWLVVDSGKQLKLTTVEQIPGLTMYRDVTQDWKQSGVWVLSGVPYFQRIRDDSGFGYNSSLELALLPVPTFLENSSKNVTDIPSLVNLLNSENITVFGRSDLFLPYDDVSPLRLGVIDLKVASGGESGFSAVAGPPHHAPSIPPFKWSTSPLRSKVSHVGQWDLYDFGLSPTLWVW